MYLIYHFQPIYSIIMFVYDEKTFAVAIIFFSLFFSTENLDGPTKVTYRIFYVC